jgi:hypothetical protein
LIKETDSLISYEVQNVSRVKVPCYFPSVTRIIKEYNLDFNTKTRSFLQKYKIVGFLFIRRIPSITMELPAGKEDGHFFLKREHQNL